MAFTPEEMNMLGLTAQQNYGPPQAMSAPPMQPDMPPPMAAPTPTNDATRQPPSPSPMPQGHAGPAEPSGVDPSTLAGASAASAGPEASAPSPAPMAPKDMGPVHMVHSKGGEVDVLGAKAHAALDEGNKTEEETIASQASRDQTTATNDMLALSNQKSEAEKQVADAGAAQARHEMELEKLHGDISKDVDKVASLKAPDPDRLWHSKSTGQKIGMNLGVLLGGIGAGFSKGPNIVLDGIQKDIDRDVDSQKQTYLMAKDSLASKQSLFGQLVQKQGSVDAAGASLRAAQLQRTQLQIDEHAARWKGTDVADRAEQAKANLAQRIAKEKASTLKLMQGGTGMVDENGVPITAAEYHTRKNLEYTQKSDTQRAEMAAAAKNGEGKSLVNLGNGQTAQALSPEAAEKFRTQNGASDKMQEDLDKIDAIRKGSTIHGAGDRAQLRSLAKDAQLNYGIAQGINRPMTPEEMDKIVPSEPGEMSPFGAIDAHLKGAREMSASTRKRLEQSYLKNPPSAPAVPAGFKD